MVITRHAGQIIRGLKGDTRPVTNVLPNAVYLETDTLQQFIFDGAGNWNPIGSVSNSAYTIYITGGTPPQVKARNNRTGNVDYSSSNDATTGDASTVINQAINNIKTITGLDANFGASVNILAGRYNCKTTIEADFDAAQRHGISVSGEGAGTLLYWSPSSLVNYGIRFQMNYPQLRNMMLWGNANLAQLCRIEGPAVATGAQYNWGVVENVSFNGTNSEIPIGGAKTISNNVNVTTGQSGLALFTDGAESGTISNFAANWKIHNCEFFGLDYGARFIGQYADMCNHSNIHIGSCRTGYYIEGVQHNLSNFRIESNAQTSTVNVGTYGIYLAVPGSGQGGNITLMNNINGELRATDGSNAYLVYIKSGVNNCYMRNMYNSAADDIKKFTVFDENIAGVNFDYDSKYNMLSPSATGRRVGYLTGMDQGIVVTTPATSTYTSGFGLCSIPNVRENVAGTGAAISTTYDGISHFDKKLSTGATTDNRASLQFVQSFHTRASEMRIFGRMRTFHNTDVRIFIGLINLGNPTPPTLFTAPVATTDILDSTNGVGLWADANVSSGQWKAAHNDGTAGASVKDAISGNPIIDTGAIHKFEIVPDDSGSKFGIRYDNVVTVVSTRIPATGTRLGWLVFIQTTAGTNKDLYLQSLVMTVIR